MSEKTMKFEIVTPEQTVLKELILQVSVPTVNGEITVLKNHIPLVATLVPGVIEVLKADSSRDIMSVSGGFIEILKDKVVILADAAERASEMDLEAVEAARQRAEDSMKNIRHEDLEKFASISAQLTHELAKSRAVKRWNKIKNPEK